MQELSGRWVWHEIMSRDMSVASEYYRGLFGWTGKEVDIGEGLGPYLMLSANGADVAGLGPAPGGAPSHWLSYLGVADLDAAVTRVAELGGRAEPMYDIPGIGRAAAVKDPDGAAFALFQGPAGQAPSRDGGAPPAMYSVCWTEHMANDPEAVARFYAGLVGWTAEPMGPDMHVLKMGEHALSSIRKMPEEAHGAPPHWMTYVLVPDVAAYADKSEGLGGRVLRGTTEVPGMGRFAVLEDPTGGIFCLWTQAG